MNSTVHEDGVAIHFSMASIRGAWVTDGKITDGMGYAQRTSKNFAELTKRRTEWVKALEKQGVQFRFLATRQIESGSLKQFRVLILPYSIALSDREIADDLVLSIRTVQSHLASAYRKLGITSRNELGSLLS